MDMHQNALEGLLKHRSLGSSLEFLGVLGGTHEFLEGSQVLLRLLAWAQDCENHYFSGL